MSADHLRAALAALLLASAPVASAATIVIVNTNAANVGFNDPAPANPSAGGDISGTLGEQRLAVFVQAAETWGRLLESDVEIRVQASMQNQTCGAGGTVLGSAGPISLASNFANAPRPDTAYHIAQANALAGVDLTPGSNHIVTTFNLALDTGCSPNAVGWWYGTDPSEAPPDNRLPLLPVVFHELGHGLGFSAQVNLGTGAYFSSNPTIWSNYLFDLQTGQHWRSMTNDQRVASAINDPNLVWSGEETNRYTSRFLSPSLAVIVHAPASIAGSYTPVQTAAFGPQLSELGVTGDLAVADPVEACGPLTNAAAIAGRIAIVDRGTCTFVEKVEFAEAAGAIAVLVTNNAAGLPPMGGASGSIGIPSLGITQALGDTLKANLPAPGVNATLGPDPGGALSGTQDGCMRMFAPNPVQQGSSVSHFSSDAFPNLLMEPALSRSIFDRVDLTIELFRDIGWVTNRDELLFYGNFDSRSCDPLPLP
jgi:hypothetical protein